MRTFRDQDAGLPLLLTVEEAGEVLRIGRTKAYAMTREWRDTGGRSGLPVIDLGHVLRVPRRALEDLVGAEINHLTPTGGPAETGDPEAAEHIVAPPAGGRVPDHEPRTTSSPRTSRARRQTTRSDDQLGLFAVKPPTT